MYAEEKKNGEGNRENHLDEENHLNVTVAENHFKYHYGGRTDPQTRHSEDRARILDSGFISGLRIHKREEQKQKYLDAA